MSKPVTFKAILAAMKQCKEGAAPGGKCDAWADLARAIAVESARQPERQQAIRRLLARSAGWRQP
jgi:hypothetical protein